jgi:hypothetical protein
MTIKNIIATPVLLTCSIIVTLLTAGITQQGFCGDKSKQVEKVFFKGNEFAFKSFPPDSVMIEDPVTEQISIRVVIQEPRPIAMNGKPIYSDDSYIRAVFNGTENTLEQFLFEQLKAELNRLDDGIYQIRASNVVVDDKGKVVYYNLQGLEPMYMPGKNTVITDGLKAEMMSRISKLLEGPVNFKPAIKDGKSINSVITIGLNPTPRIVVRDHVATLE